MKGVIIRGVVLGLLLASLNCMTVYGETVSTQPVITISRQPPIVIRYEQKEEPVTKQEQTEETKEIEETEEQEKSQALPTIYDLYSEEEVTYLFRTVETETYTAPYEAKKNIASVILNRADETGTNLKALITAPNQFAHGRTDISDMTVKACEDALYDRGEVKDAWHFKSSKKTETFCGRKFITYDGYHNFY